MLYFSASCPFKQQKNMSKVLKKNIKMELIQEYLHLL